MSMKRDDVIQNLCSTYRKYPQIGLVLGAGVSRESGVPTWEKLALELFELAKKEKVLRRAPSRAQVFLEEQLEELRSNREDRRGPDPDKVLQFIHDYVQSEYNLAKLIKQILYRKDRNGKDRDVLRPQSKTMLVKSVYQENRTLNAVISFCAADPKSELPESEKAQRWDTNKKVGAILTTNYDNLVEGSFNSKYGVKLLDPVAREGPPETHKDRHGRVIPVYHMHGYVSYVYDNKGDKGLGGVKASEIVLAEEHYYQTFYNILGFSNRVALNFLRQFPCIFVGCSMVDRNLRRILYQRQREDEYLSDPKERFAILPSNSSIGDDFDDAVLRSFGVTAIRADPEQIGCQVEAILRRLYLSVDGVEEKDWNRVMEGRWRTRKGRVQ